MPRTRFGIFIVLPVLVVALPAWGQAPDWSVNPAQFPSNMSVTAVLEVNGLPEDGAENLVGAFVGEEVRGVVAPVASGGRQLYFLTVYGRAEGETVSFRVYLAASNQTVAVGDTLAFASNGVVGSVAEPLVWRVRLATGCQAGQPVWEVNPPSFESNMNVTASVWAGAGHTPGVEDLLAAFAGEEVRGVAGPTEVGGRPVFFLTVYADGNGDMIRFRYYDAAADRVYGVTDSLVFVSNALHGSPSNPLTLNTACNLTLTSAGDEAPVPPSPVVQVSSYPNPFHRTATLVYTLAAPSHVEVVLYDVQGRAVRRWNEGMRSAGAHRLHVEAEDLPPGIYLYAIRTGNTTLTGRLVRK